MLSARSVALLEARVVLRCSPTVRNLSAVAQPPTHSVKAPQAPRQRRSTRSPPSLPSGQIPLHHSKVRPIKFEELPRIFRTRTSWITRTLAQGHHIPRNLLLKLLASRQIPPDALAVWVDVLARRDPVYALEQLGLLESATSGMRDIGRGGPGSGASVAAAGGLAPELVCPDWLYLSLPGLVSEQWHVPYLASQLLSPRFARLSEDHRGLFTARCVQHFLKVQHYVALRETIEWVAYSAPSDEAALSSPRSYERLLAALASERTSPNTLTTTPRHILRPLADLLIAAMNSRNLPRTHRTYLPLFTDKLIPHDPREATRLLIEMSQAGFSPSKDILAKVVEVMQRSGEFKNAAELHEEIRALQRARADARSWVESARREHIPLDVTARKDPPGELQAGDDPPPHGEEYAIDETEEDAEKTLHDELKRVKELRLEGASRHEAAAVAQKPPPFALRYLPEDLQPSEVDIQALSSASATSALRPATSPTAGPPPLEHDPYATSRLVDPAVSRPYWDELIDYVSSTSRTISFPPPPFRFDGPAWTNLFRMAATQSDIPSATLVAVAHAVERAAASLDLAAASTRSAAAYRPPPPSLRIYTILLRTLHRRGEHTAALDLWRSLDARQFQPDGHLLDAVVRVLCSLNRDEAALRVLDYFGVVRGRDDVVVIPQLTPSQAPRQRTLREGTVPLDIVPFNALLAYYNRTGAHARVHALWRALEPKYGVRPDAATLSIVLDAARFAGQAAGRATTGWTGRGLDDLALGGVGSSGGARLGQGVAVDDRWTGRPAHKVAEEFLWREVLEANWQDARMRNPALPRAWSATGAPSGSGSAGRLVGWFAGKLSGGVSSTHAESPVAPPHGRPEGTSSASGFSRPPGWAAFATTLSPHPPAHPHLYPNDRVFRSLIQLVGTHAHLRDLPLLTAWMRHLRVRPSRWTLCLAMAYVDGDAGITPAQSAQWRRWLVEWLGPKAVPGEAEIAWMRRGGRAAGVPEVRS